MHDSRDAAPESGRAARLFTRCPFCLRAFPPNDLFGTVPPGRRLAYDPAAGRLWSICGTCARWCLVPVDERLDAIWQLERLVRATGAPIARTDEIALYDLNALQAVRVGPAPATEQAWWRYGRSITRRRIDEARLGNRIAAGAYGAVAFAGEYLGLLDLGLRWDRTALADVQRWRRFGPAAWHGRSACPHCGSVLRTLRYDVSWWLYPRMEDQRLVLGVPCTRCDPWSRDDVFDITGDEAVRVLRRALAYQHISGATERQVRAATAEIGRAGGPDRFVMLAATGRSSIWRMGPFRALALEIALGEAAEAEEAASRLYALEEQWRREDELARIVDEELTPGWELRRHVRRLADRDRGAR